MGRINSTSVGGCGADVRYNSRADTACNTGKAPRLMGSILLIAAITLAALALFSAGIHAHRVFRKRKEMQRRVKDIRERYTRDSADTL